MSELQRSLQPIKPISTYALIPLTWGLPAGGCPAFSSFSSEDIIVISYINKNYAEFI